MLNLFNFYGLDWLAMTLSVMAVWMLGNKNKNGFIIFIVANLMWIAISATLIHGYGVILGNAFFVVSNTRGYMRWVDRMY
ncbi:hypothetical protein [Ekhidna sp. To15]|uniref:hypothetical protein n=1 Tax=Ekhidna sp. To15 TaxID=3395267 RepID=UPI003F520354